MATKRGKRSTKKVKTLGSKNLPADKAKGVRAGTFGVKVGEGVRQKIVDNGIGRTFYTGGPTR